MLRNYYYLNRTTVELNKLLSGAEVLEIYAQEKNSIYFAIPTEEKPNRHLFISTNSSLPYLLIKEDHRKAKKNIYQIDIIEKQESITSIEISKNDRLIKISFSSFELYFSIMGGKTNIYFVRDGKVIEKLRKSKEEENILERIKETEFINEFVFHEIEEKVFDGYETKSVKKVYPFIPKEIVNEMKYRGGSLLSKVSLFHELLNGLYSNDIKVFISADEGKTRFVPMSFKTFANYEGKSFDNCNDAIHEYLRQHFRFQKKDALQKEISQVLNKELERTANRLNNLKARIDKGERSTEYYNYANQLLANRHLLKKGMEKIDVVDYNTGEELSIKLSKKNTPQESIDLYFEKAKDEKINYQKSVELYNSSLEKHNFLKKIKTKYNASDKIDDLIEIKKLLKISDKKNGKKKVIDGVKLREFLVEGKYRVLVGRDSKSNDMLSIKIAKQNDYWFHARGLPGSHVVLRVDNPKEGIPKNILKNVAQIAAFYSKAKTAGTAPVSYTLGKYVRKKKGMEPGKVLIEKEKVLLVRPEIPKNTELVTDE